MYIIFLFADSLSAAIEAISVSTELVEDELKPYLDAVLNVAIERSEHLTVLYIIFVYIKYFLDLDGVSNVCD